jgi:hypothetical protein
VSATDITKRNSRRDGSSTNDEKKITFDPSIPENRQGNSDADVFGRRGRGGSASVPGELNTLRESRHNKIRSNASMASGHVGNHPQQAARKHYRGWLEKLPVELSQRERERLKNKKQHARLSDTATDSPAAGGEKPKVAVGRSMLLSGLKGLSQMGSSMLVQRRKSGSQLPSDLGRMEENFSELNTDVVKLNRINGNWKRRFFQAQSNQKSSSLVYWATEEDCRNGRDKRGDFPLDDSNSRIFESSPFGPFAFSITGTKGRLHLRASSLKEKNEWIAVFKTALAFRGGADKAKLFDKGGEGVSSIMDKKDLFTDSFVNMDDLVKEHSSLLDLERRGSAERQDNDAEG